MSDLVERLRAISANIPGNVDAGDVWDAATLIEQQAEMLLECLSFAGRIEAAGNLAYEGKNFERWKATARELAPRLRKHLFQSPPDEGE